MFCGKCGKEFEPQGDFCPFCGAKNQEGQKLSNVTEGKVATSKVSGAVDTKNDTVGTEGAINTYSIPNYKTNVKVKKPVNKKLIIGIVAAVFLLLLIIILVPSPKIVSISAKYDGDTTQGTVLNSNNSGIEVTGKTEKGKEKSISGWEIKKPATLEADESATVTITYEELETELTVECSSSKVTSINIEYSGETKAGSTISKESSDLKITAQLKNGEEVDIKDDASVQLSDTQFKENESVTISVFYADPVDDEEFEKEEIIDCSTVTIIGISAKYSGDYSAGTVLDENNSGIEVTAKYKSGESKQIDGWKVKKAVKLKADTTSTVVITYMDMTCNLKVTCSTMSAKKYKATCKSVSYDSLARDPEKYKGKLVKFYGRVVQVQESDSILYYSVYRINVGNDGYGYYDDTVYVTYDSSKSSSRILEDDMVTFYGEYKGLTTYETVMGASITIPHVHAEYITR